MTWTRNSTTKIHDTPSAYHYASPSSRRRRDLYLIRAGSIQWVRISRYARNDKPAEKPQHQLQFALEYILLLTSPAPGMSSDSNISPTDELSLTFYRNTGKQEVMGELFNKYMHLVYGLCLKYLKNREDAQDAVMSIYESISKKLLTLEVEHFKSWLYIVSKNHCLMELRKQNPEVSSEIFMESPDDMHLKNEKMQLEKDLDVLEKCIEELKEEQKRCVQLFFLQKQSYQQVTDSTGVELKKVKSHIQNGKRNLKICLEAKHVSR